MVAGMIGGSFSRALYSSIIASSIPWIISGLPSILPMPFHLRSGPIQECYAIEGTKKTGGDFIATPPA
jgi:hypothetical protein